MDDEPWDVVEGGDPSKVLRAVDGLCATRDWDGLVRLRGLLTDALERGRPTWPLITWVEYRLALEAPGRQAAAVLRPGAGRFAVGPLAEVAASRHTWAELAGHLDDPAVAGTVAAERVLRGEDLRDAAAGVADVMELPLHLQPWEPAYGVATYTSDGIDAPGPPGIDEPRPARAPRAPAARRAAPEVTAVRRAATDVTRALLDLVEVWTSESEGAARAEVVDGDATAAVHALGIAGPRLAPLEPGTALAWMAWAAASGGAHGVRRGAALGRFDAWWAAAALTGLDWPPDPDTLGAALARLRWWAWDDGAPLTGWVLRLAVENPNAGWAVALDARDTSTQPERRRASRDDDGD